MKSIKLAFFTLFILCSSSLAHADDQNACGAILCLFGVLTGGSGGDSCSNYASSYFSILKFGKHGGFDPRATSNARLGFLNSCPSAPSDNISQVNNAFGSIYGL